MALKISEEVKVQMPMKTVASLIAIVAIGTWAFFSFQEKLNQHSTQLEIMSKDLILNSEFRIGWPRGLLGSLPADSEQFMLIEELYKQTDKLEIRVDGMLHNEVNIKALDKAVDKLQSDVEKLKDKQGVLQMGTITSGVIVLCMFYQGGIIEHTYIQSQKMSDCLKAKRTVERSVNPQNVRMQCGEVDAIIEKDEYSDKMRVVKIIKDKYDSSGYTNQ